MNVAWMVGGALALLAAYLSFWPVGIDPARWMPAPAPALVGPFAENGVLDDMERLKVGRGPESVAVDSLGRVIAGLEDGRIVRWQAATGEPETVARILGRPLGLAYDASENLWVCDLNGRLLEISQAGVVREAVAAWGGRRLGLVNAVDVDVNGRVLFTESSTQTTDTVADLLEHRPNGRLLAYDPKRGATDVLLDGLYYANGVALSADETFVLVAETTEYRVRRLWLSGPRAGESETFVDNLPGFPDGISCDAGGIFWLALVNPRSAFLDWTLPHPWTRRVAARLPLSWFESSAPRWGSILALDAEGHVIANLRTSSARGYAGISSAVVVGGVLYTGSLLEDAVGRLRLP
ncbi:MAG: SMP-30/gluconolactonase/LRE family protein [Candidatus Bipolaricaulota bacterium]